MDDLDPLIGSSEMRQAFPVFAKVDYTMYTDEVKQYMKANLPDIENIVICGLEVFLLGGVDGRLISVYCKLVWI